MPLLEIRNLSVTFATAAGPFRAVDSIDLDVDPGEVVAIVGEFGSGKSVSMLALMGLLPKTATVTADRLAFAGEDLTRLSSRRRRQVIGKEIAMIFQEPIASLNPCFTAGFQIGEALKTHLDVDRAERKERVIALLREVGISEPERRYSAFPHQLSGGMSQRVMIAMALACRPKLLIADEPTTALDVTIQAQILDLLVALQKSHGMALVLVTHNMGVVAETAQRVVVQYAGQQVERQSVHGLFAQATPSLYVGAARRPSRPRYRRSPAGHSRCRARPRRPAERLPVPSALQPGHRTLRESRSARAAGRTRPRALPLSPQRPERSGMSAVIEAVDLARHYNVSRGAFRAPATVKALAGATFSVEPGRTLAIVGESGCGKSTLARLITMIEPATSGHLMIDGVDIAEGGGKVRALRSTVQIVFQNPYGSLNPRQKIGTILEEPLVINTRLGAGERRRRALDMLSRVGLRQEHYGRYPHMFSGGQRQRIAIARALMLEPKILVLDEPVSALDVSIQAQILNLLADLQDQFGLTYVFISHDLSVVRFVADDVMVMYLGRPVEIAPVEEIFRRPQHPYTRALLSATPVADPDQKRPKIKLEGELPSPFDPPSGCAFHPRCPYVRPPVCTEVPPPLFRAGPTLHACHGVEQGWVPQMPEVAPLRA